MHSTLELIELAKQRLAAKQGLELPMTDYRLAKILALKLQTVSNWRTGKTTISADFVNTFATACDLQPEYVYACIEHEREGNPDVQKVLQRIAKAFKGKVVPAAGSAILALGLVGSPRSEAMNSELLRTSSNEVCRVDSILCQVCRARRRTRVRRWPALLSWPALWLSAARERSYA